MRILIKSVLLLGLITSSLPTLASFPFPNGECQLKTGVQTWNTASKPELKLKDSSLIKNPENSPFVGFRKKDIEDNHNNSCGSDVKCSANKTLRVDRPEFIHNHNYGEGEREFESDGKLAGPVNLKEVKIKGSAVVLFTGGEYWIKELKISENAQLKITAKTVINVEELSVKGKIINKGAISDLIIIAHGHIDDDDDDGAVELDDGEIKIDTEHEDEIRGYIFAEDEIKLENKAHIRGAIVAKEIEMEDSSKVVTDLSDCMPTPPEFDMCDLYKYPAGAWSDGASVTFSNPPDFPSSAQNKYYIGGWKTEFCHPSDSNCEAVKTSFDDFSHDYSSGANTCQLAPCSTGGQKVDTKKMPAVMLPSLSGSVTLNYNRPDEVTDNGLCQVEALGDSCHEQGKGDGVITLGKSLASLTLSHGGNGYPVTLVIPDNKTIYIGQLLSNSTNVTVHIGENSRLVVDSFNLNSPSNKLTSGANARLYVASSFNLSNPTEVNPDTSPDNLLIYAPSDSSTAIFNSSPDVTVNAHLLFGKVTMNQGGVYGGSVITNDLIIYDKKTVILGKNRCFGSNDNYTLELSPLKQFFLLCEQPLATFRVLNDNNEIAENYSGEIDITRSSELVIDQVVIGQKVGDGKYRPEKGLLQLKLKASKIGNFSLQGQLSTDANQSQTGGYYIAPYKFDIPEVGAIAGKSTAFDIQVLACKNDKVTPVTGYDGERTLTYTNSTLTSPKGGTNPALEILASENAQNTTKQVKLKFFDGKAGAYMKYAESGGIWSQLSDPNFACPEGFDCQLEDSEVWSGLKGILNVKLRPWTFAICPTGSKTMDGTSSGGEAFIAAGDTFELDIKPIIYRSEGSMQAEYDLCSVATTKNFYNSGAWPAKVSLTHKVASPASANDGSFTGTLEKLNTAASSSMMIRFDGLSITEVGSFNIYAASQDSIYKNIQGGIEQGVREIGRFYPKYFRNIDNTWDYPDARSFTYMNQAFDGLEFKVEALNASKGVLKNYYHSGYNNSLRAKFALFENSSNVFRLKSPVIDAGDWTDNLVKSKSVGVFNYSKKSLDCGTEFCWMKGKNATYLDGPFNLGSKSSTTFISIDNAGSVDPIAFASTEDQKLTLQPDVRFGRIVLEDVGGTQGKPISIPLKVEYWDGESFVKSKDDNSTSFDGKHYHTQPIWQAEALANNIILAKTGTVSNGESRSLEASQVKVMRERSRIWLELANGKNSLPWLQYDWSNNVGEDEEDPSAVVTFGSYRGNDRVIFRGESRLTGH